MFLMEAELIPSKTIVIQGLPRISKPAPIHIGAVPPASGSSSPYLKSLHAQSFVGLLRQYL